MVGKVLAALLVFGWISLSAFDLLEDLKVPSEYTAYAQSGKPASHNAGRPINLANNMVESAIKAPAADTPLLRPDSSQSPLRSLWSFHRAQDLHKLHRVFLI
jgi:hypothetical protein